MMDALVLCYHALSNTWGATLSTTPVRFERQLRLLLSRGYRALTFGEAVASPHQEGIFVVTFDDAYHSVLSLARPILDRLGITATVFAPTDFIGSERAMRWAGIERWLGGPHEAELVPMTWADLRTLADEGWEIGSHTRSHPRLTQVDDSTLEDQLVRSKRACEEHLGRACTSLAYPYGDVDARVIEAAPRAGYRAAAALPDHGLGPSGRFNYPRIGIYRADGDLRFRLKVAPSTALLRRLGPWELVSARRRATTQPTPS